MSYRVKINRREFLLSVSTVGGGLAWGILIFQKGCRTPTAEIPIPGVDDLKALQGARKLGAAYLKAHPREASVERLTENLLMDLVGDSGVPPEKVRVTINHRIEGDYRDREVLLANGWLFARTELRLCALASLL